MVDASLAVGGELMNVRERVERARRRLRGAEIAAGLLEALAVAGAVFVAMAIVDALLTLPIVIRMTAPPLAVIAAVALLSQRFVRRRTGAHADDVALWIEARFPDLRYALVTAVDPEYVGRVPEIERTAGLVPFEPEISRAAWRAIARPLIAVAIATLVLFLLHTVLLGMGGYFELWDAATYAAQEAEQMKGEMPDVFRDFSF